MNGIEKLWKILGGRKFLAFLIATGLVIPKCITPEIWVTTFFVYCAANLFGQFIEVNGKKKVD